MVTHREAGLGLVDVVYQVEQGGTLVPGSDSLASMKSFL